MSLENRKECNEENNEENNEKRSYEQIAVLIIADGFALGFRGKLRARRDLLHISTPLALYHPDRGVTHAWLQEEKLRRRGCLAPQ